MATAAPLSLPPVSQLPPLVLIALFVVFFRLPDGVHSHQSHLYPNNYGRDDMGVSSPREYALPQYRTAGEAAAVGAGVT